MKITINKQDFIKIKTFYRLKDNFNRMKKIKPHTGGKYLDKVQQRKNKS
jgi:hypothetical protein